MTVELPSEVQAILDANAGELTLDELLAFLDEVRESGAINMFGAGPVLVSTYDLSKHDARTILSYWMKTFSDRKDNY